MTKAGQADIRRLLVIGAMSRLAWTAYNSGGQLAVTHVGTQAKDAGRNRAGQQDGPTDVGDADKERVLQGSGASRLGMILTPNR